MQSCWLVYGAWCPGGHVLPYGVAASALLSARLGSTFKSSGGRASIDAVAEVWTASKLRRVSGRRPVKTSRAKYVEKETGATEIGDAQESANGVSAQ